MTDGIIVDPLAQEQEELEEEEQLDTTDPEVPEKYKGKSLVDVVEMHRNAESELGRRANEIGHYRSLIDELITVKRERDLADNQDDDDALEISGDDLLRDPVSALSQVVERALDKRFKPLEAERQQERERTAQEQFESDFPNAEEIAQDPEFHKWILRKPSRLEDAKTAAQNDIGAARRLLENYLDFQEASKPPVVETDEEIDNGNKRKDNTSALTGVDGAKRVATDRGGDSSPAGKKLFYQSEVVDLMINNPDKYKSEAYQSQLLKAIKEGRLRK